MKKTSKWDPYIKPTRYIHESGYRCFETGYIDESSNQKIILGKSSDHIGIGDLFLKNLSTEDFHIDLTLQGYLRFFSLINNPLKWRMNLKYATSDMYVIKGEFKPSVDYKIINF